jgi:hypothetical protein
MTDAFPEAAVADRLIVYGYPVVIVVGVVCNTLALITLQSPHFKGKTIRLTLSLLSIVDTLLLVLGMLRLWLIALIQFDVRSVHGVVCDLHTFITYLLPQLSSWTVLLISIERTLVVQMPFWARRSFNTVRVFIAWFGVLLFLTTANVPLLFAMEVRKPTVSAANNATFECLVKKSWETFIKDVMYWLDFVLVTFPAIVIFALNCFILVKLRRPKSRLGSSAVNMAASQTRMLLVLTFAFVVSILPLQLYFVVAKTWIWSVDEPRVIAQLMLAYSICTFLFYWNSAVNFFLYALSGSLFRQALLSLGCCWKKTPQTLPFPSSRVQASASQQELNCLASSSSFPDVVPLGETNRVFDVLPSELETTSTRL